MSSETKDIIIYLRGNYHVINVQADHAEQVTACLDDALMGNCRFVSLQGNDGVVAKIKAEIIDGYYIRNARKDINEEILKTSKQAVEILREQSDNSKEGDGWKE